MTQIQGIFAREVLNGVGDPTIECTLWTNTGLVAASIAPSSFSQRKFSLPQFDDSNHEWMLGKGVGKNIEILHNVISQRLIGQDPLNQELIDNILLELQQDPSVKLDARLSLAISQANLKLASLTTDTPLYLYVKSMLGIEDELFIPDTISPIVGGGILGTDNLDFAQFLILPVTHLSFSQEINLIKSIYTHFKKILIMKNAIYAQSESGLLVPNLYSNSDVFDLLIEAVKTSVYTFGQDLFFGLTADADNFQKSGKYKLKDKADTYTNTELFDYYQKLKKIYHITYLEDPFQIEAEKDWQKITQELGESTFVAGNKTIGSNQERILKASSSNMCNCIVLNLIDQATITTLLHNILLAKNNGLKVVLSIAEAETTDDFFADFAVGIGSEYVKLGPPSRGEHIAKYNRLWQIEQEINYHENS